MAGSTLHAAASRLAGLLTSGDTTPADPSGSDLVFEDAVVPVPLTRGVAPADVWAVDGGQALVADARCLQLWVTRAARVRFRDGDCVLEDEGELRAGLLGGRETRTAVDALGVPVAPDAGLEGAAHLLRDGGEWLAVERCIADAEPHALVLVDGDLQPDWRIPSAWIASVYAAAARKGVRLVGVTKHSSLSRGGAPLLGALEIEAAEAFGARAMWWAPVARTRPDLDACGRGLQIVAARLDPDARFAFRVDLPADVDPAAVLGALSALCDDAAFPGYPYPLSVADRLAACPPWLSDDVRFELETLMDQHGVPLEVRERAFADRHALMERA